MLLILTISFTKNMTGLKLTVLNAINNEKYKVYKIICTNLGIIS